MKPLPFNLEQLSAVVHAAHEHQHPDLLRGSYRQLRQFWPDWQRSEQQFAAKMAAIRRSRAASISNALFTLTPVSPHEITPGETYLATTAGTTTAIHRIVNAETPRHIIEQYQHLHRLDLCTPHPNQKPSAKQLPAGNKKPTPSATATTPPAEMFPG